MVSTSQLLAKILASKVEMATQLPAGAVRKTNGEVVIPATRRPDGTWRKEVRVREGYVPQEERGTFQTKAHRVREQPNNY